MTERSGAWWVFWVAFSFIVYTYIGFPLLTALRSLFWRRPVVRGPDRPMVSIIIAAYNEAAIISSKLENTLALDYPRASLEIIVASDGSSDGTNELVQRCDASQVRLLTLTRQGKNSAVNSAVCATHGDILIFTDADTKLAPDALQHLVAPFSDPSVGGVCGEHQYGRKSNGNRTEQVKRRMKLMLSATGSTTAGEGQIYALRRDLFTPIPKSVNDDFYNFLQVPAAQRRLIFEPRAVAYPLTNDKVRHAAFPRKVRIHTRVLQTFWVMRRLLNPFQYGFYAIQLVSHKLFRRFVFPALLLVGATATMLWQNDRFYKAVALSQLALYLVAALGFLLAKIRPKRIKGLKKPYNFIRNGTAFLVALLNFITGKRYEMWAHSDGPHQNAGGRS
jgi:cellulose synthase/poly-beta-1,6-N-acetylglucosamine synthase-like glycosyltransferase